ncbi:winged helix-turn-helix domain-containing protein [Mesorhizobium sp. SB112]|uniref:ArsR/SmtB family transcription factor n=1 Tax=Mesorhizobium sp. SB112 TaxID=3151853 RepID=UPI0032640055
MNEVVVKANALSNDKRLQILEWLKDPLGNFSPQYPIDENEGVCGLYIAEKLRVSPATASVHLKILTQAGFLRPLRIGKFTYFKRVETSFADLARAIESI